METAQEVGAGRYLDTGAVRCRLVGKHCTVILRLSQQYRSGTALVPAHSVQYPVIGRLRQQYRSGTALVPAHSVQFPVTVVQCDVNSLISGSSLHQPLSLHRASVPLRGCTILSY